MESVAGEIIINLITVMPRTSPPSLLFFVFFNTSPSIDWLSVAMQTVTLVAFCGI